MIEGVIVEPLKQIKDDRGVVMHMLRCDSAIFEKFGEVYFSGVNQNAVKAWKLHRSMTLNLAVPVGAIKLVLYDNRADSRTKGKVQELFIGEDNYCLVKIPPMIWNGFQGLSERQAIVANCSTLPHDPDEVERLDPFNDSIPYNWNTKRV